MTEQTSNPDFTKSDCYQAEKNAFDSRRDALFKDETRPDRPWGLALSGGGIRSATFALGVLQSLAKAPNSPSAAEKASPLLARFDYLSTVSGGGYVGAFMSALFRSPTSRGNAGKATNDKIEAEKLSTSAYTCLAADPPGRMTAATTAATPDHPLRWLRENGRYMAPAGAGDMFYALSLQIRSWCAIQYVIGITLLLAFLTGLSFRAVTQLPPVNTSLGGLPVQIEAYMQPAGNGGIWWSPWFWFALLAMALVTVPIGISYWLTYRPKPDATRLEKMLPPTIVAAVALAACVFELATLASTSGAATVLIVTIAWIAWATTTAVCLFWLSSADGAVVSAQRVTLTHWLTAALVITLALVFFGLVETASQSLYLLAHQATGSPAPTLTAATAAAAVAVSLIKKLAETATNGKPGGLLSKIPLSTVMGLIAVVFVFILATTWHLLGLLLFFGGNSPWEIKTASDGIMIAAPLAIHSYPYPLALFAVTAFGVLAAGYFVGFVNLSSLATLYSARLTRAYLGASNAKRFVAGGSKWREVAEPEPDDDIKSSNFYQTTHYGPLHLINVTINCTTGSEGRLTQLDRKGIPLAITPNGLSVNGDEPLPFAGAGEDLTIGQWIGISGAAFSPGIGRGTSIGLAAVCTLANVRLGYWWDSQKKRETTWTKLTMLVRNQRYLIREMTGRFFGISRHFWYLSDGGHFENTGVYELLRRRCSVVVTCDDGADSGYQFDDLANLMRLARIDFGAEFTVLPPSVAVTEFQRAGLHLGPKALACFAASPNDLDKERGASAHCAIAYRVTYQEFQNEPTLLLVVKPRLTKDAPLDLIQYQATHAAFPQESTLDQFFDEAQWESYRKLGALNGDGLFAR